MPSLIRALSQSLGREITSRVTRVLDRPEPGHYAVGFAKNALLIGCKICHEAPRDPWTDEPLDRSWEWSALIDGEASGFPGPQPTRAVWMIWTSGEPIDAVDYETLLMQAAWDRQYARSVIAAEFEKEHA